MIDEADETQESIRSENPLDAFDSLVERFTVPLEGAAAEASVIRGKFEAMVSYAIQFISSSTMEYQSV